MPCFSTIYFNITSVMQRMAVPPNRSLHFRGFYLIWNANVLSPGVKHVPPIYSRSVIVLREEHTSWIFSLRRFLRPVARSLVQCMHICSFAACFILDGPQCMSFLQRKRQNDEHFLKLCIPKWFSMMDRQFLLRSVLAVTGEARTAVGEDRHFRFPSSP
jgi:hypothetical protein